MRTSCFDTHFVSQIKSTKFPSIYCFAFCCTRRNTYMRSLSFAFTSKPWAVFVRPKDFCARYSIRSHASSRSSIHFVATFNSFCNDQSVTYLMKQMKRRRQRSSICHHVQQEQSSFCTSSLSSFWKFPVRLSSPAGLSSSVAVSSLNIASVTSTPVFRALHS